MRRRIAVLIALVALVMCMGVTPALAYFTDSTEASGGLVIGTKSTTHMDEEYADGVKHVTVTNDEKSTVAVFVRARAYSTEKITVSGEGWAAEGDWYVYGEAVDPGDSTTPLDVEITFPTRKKADKDPKGYEIGDNFNVVVVYESTPAKYDENNNPAPDWSLVYDTVAEERGK